MSNSSNVVSFPNMIGQREKNNQEKTLKDNGLKSIDGTVSADSVAIVLEYKASIASLKDSLLSEVLEELKEAGKKLIKHEVNDLIQELIAKVDCELNFDTRLGTATKLI